ncbi:hypothetical protein SAZ11_49090 [Streptomyces sp. FXJ1.4098]|nr:hypothetical protein [Streptomyces sp. FXJ1.4098]
MLHGDLGQSYRFHRSVASLIGDRLESTLELALFATLLVVLIGTTLGCSPVRPSADGRGQASTWATAS